MINFSGIALPFSPADLLNSGVGLLGVVGGFVLLAMAFLVVRPLVNMVLNAFSIKDGANRDEHGNRIRS